jgi:hypothetical protein
MPREILANNLQGRKRRVVRAGWKGTGRRKQYVVGRSVSACTGVLVFIGYIHIRRKRESNLKCLDVGFAKGGDPDFATRLT